MVVTFIVSGSGASGTFAGSLTATATKNASGDAQSPVLTANATAGSHTVNATTTGVGAPAAFVLTNLAPTPATVTASPANGTPQTAAINTAFATALGVLVKDLNGINLSGQSVTFTVNAAGGAGATFAGGASTVTVSTNGSGIATAPALTANGVAGTYTVTATAGSITFTFTLTNRAPALITATAGSSQTAVINTNFATQLQATVVDSTSTPVAGVTVTFTAPGTGASATFSGAATVTAVTNAQGIATATVARANGTAGSYTVTAAVAGVATAASFGLTNTAPASVAATAGSGQTTVVNTNFATQLQATVLDASGTPVAGATVTFTAPGSGASGTFSGSATATALTNASGVATATVIRANATPGTFTVNATVAGVAAPASFTLTSILATPASVVASPVNGTPQSAVVNTAFATALGVLVQDSGGTIIVGTQVTFTVNAAGGAGASFAGGLTSVTVATNASGIASSPTVTANGVAGSYTVTATAGSISFTFSLANTALPASITATGGNNQSATISASFATRLQATVLDGSGAAVPGAVVLFSAPTTGARATFSGAATATAVTNASGVALAPVASAGTVAGSYAVTATVQGSAVATTFTLTNSPGAAATIAIASGNAQTSALGAAFAQPLVAVVRDASGNAAPGVSVTFGAPTSGARATFAGGAASATVTTDASGNATSPTLTAAAATGGYSVTAKVGNTTPSVSFSLTNGAAVPGTVALQAGSTQSTVVNTNFGTALQAKVTDTQGNPVNNVSVTFTLPGSGASGTFAGATTATATTNASGIATSPTLKANTTAGTFFAQATATGITAPAVFTLTNNADTPVAISVVQGTPQSTIVSTAFAAPLVAQVKDVFGNPVPNATVNFLAPTVGSVAKFPGAANSAAATTDATGKATSPLPTANAIAGSYTITASIPSGSFVNFNLTNSPAPARIDATGGGPQSTRVTTAFGTPLQVTVKDAANFPVSGVTVTFTAPASGAAASMSSTTAVTNSSGVASITVTANATAGSYVVSAAVSGVAAPATFALTNTASAPATIVATGGDAQTTRVSTAFASPLQVSVKDAANNPVAGITVTFSAPGSGASGTLSATTATTDASGTASITVTANGKAGTFAVSASIAGVGTPATFSLTNTVIVPTSIVVSGGGTQSTKVTTAFATPLQVTVKGTGDVPVPGIEVTFTAPASGASAKLSSTTVTTDASGAASVTATANATVGAFSVTATVAGVATPAVFTLTNTGTTGLKLSVSASTTSFSGPGQPIVFTYVPQNTGTVTITGLAVSDAKVGGIVCATTSLAAGASTTCTATYTSTVADVTGRVGIVSVASATGSTIVGAVAAAEVTTRIGIDEEAVRRKTLAANRGLMESRAQALTNMAPNAQRLHHRLTSSIFGGGSTADDPAPDAAPARGEAARPTIGPAPGSIASEVLGRHEPLKLGAPLPLSGGGNSPAIAGPGGLRGTATPPLPSGVSPGNDFDAARPALSQAGTSMPFTFGGAAEDGSGRFNFAGSLSQMRKAAEADEAARMAAGLEGARGSGLSLNPSVAGGQRKREDTIDACVEGQAAYFTSDRIDGRRSGHAAVLYYGVDAVVRPGVLFGFLVQHDWIKDSSSTLGQNREGTGWMAGPYIGLRLTPNLYFDARYAHGTASNKVDPIGAYVDQFSTTRDLASARLTGDWNYGAWRFRPSAEVTYYSEVQKAYVNEIGITIPGTRVSLGRAAFGPEVSYRFEMRDKSVLEPYVSLKGVWDFAKDNPQADAGLTGAIDTFSARLQAGASYQTSGGVTFRASGGIDGLGSSGYQAVRGQVFLIVPLQ